MSSRVFTDAALAVLGNQPPSRRGPGYQTVPCCWRDYDRFELDEDIDFPVDLNSVEFLNFAGFNPLIAHHIWQSWNSKHPRERYPFVFQEALDHIREKARHFEAIDPTNNGCIALLHMGVSKGLWRFVFSTDLAESLSYSTKRASNWLIHIVEKAFYFLRSLADAIERLSRAQSLLSWKYQPTILGVS